MKHNATRVVWINKAGAAHTFCFINNAPQYIINAVNRVKRAADIPKTGPLTEYYGRDLNHIFGADIARKPLAYLNELIFERNSALSVFGGAVTTAQSEIDSIERALLEEESEKPLARKLSTGDQISDFAPGEITIIPDIPIFAEDSMMDVKRKIFAACNLPTYRQHLIAVRGEYFSQSYGVYAAGEYVVDPRVLINGHRDVTQILDIPIDRSLYDNRDDLHIEARDSITLVGEQPPDYFFVFDIAHWIVPRLETIRPTLADNYQFELLYYGFCAKYFPHFTREVFHAYIESESMLQDRFPDLAPVHSIVRGAVRAQCSIAGRLHTHSLARIDTDLSRIILNASIDARAIGSQLIPINIRSTFDNIICSETIPFVRAITVSSRDMHSDGSQKFELRKIYKGSALMSAITQLGTMPPTGSDQMIMIAFVPRGTRDVMFVVARPTGAIHYNIAWSEEDAIDFGEMKDRFMKYSAAFIAELEKSGTFLANTISAVTAHNFRLRSQTTMTRWRRALSTSQFRELRGMWGDYIRAGIIIPRQTHRDEFSFIFTRGIIDIDSRRLDTHLASAGIIEANQYAYLSSSAVRQKWYQNYAGRVVNVLHRASDITFEVHDARESEQIIFEKYINDFIHTSRQLIGGKSKDAQYVDTGSRLRRMHELDPVLYDIKKHGAPRVYSTRCQHEKQPILYSDKETPPANAVKYWNFTTNRPAYYSCPDKRYPHLNFITGVHPKKYCIPCCGRLAAARSHRRMRIADECTRTHTFTDATHGIRGVQGYIMSFGVDLPIDRVSRLPSGFLRDSVNRAINAILPGTELLSYGIAQETGIIEVISLILEHPRSKIIRDIVGAIASGIIHFEMVDGGNAATYFATRDTFIGYLGRLASGAESSFPRGTGDFMRRVITDCVRVVYGLHMIYIITPPLEHTGSQQISASRETIDAWRTNPASITEIGAALLVADNIYPIFAINTSDFTRAGIITSRTIPTQACAVLLDALGSRSARRITGTIARIYCETHGLQISAQYVGLRGLTFGISASNTAGVNVYIPVDYCAPLLAIPHGNIHEIRANGMESMKVIRDLDCTPGEIVYVASRVIGFIVACDDGWRAICYCDLAHDDIPKYAQSLKLLSDPRSVLNISESRCTAMEAINTAAVTASYPYYEYDLFCAQFVSVIEGMRDTKLRAKIDAAWERDASSSRRLAIEELGLSPADRAIALSANRARPMEADRREFTNILTRSTDDIAKWIAQLMREYIVEDTSALARVPAFITSCSTKGRSILPHCSSGKLYIRTGLETLCKILASDLRDTIKRSYIFSRGITPESRTLMGDFEIRSSEIIIIRRYEESRII